MSRVRKWFGTDLMEKLFLVGLILCVIATVVITVSVREIQVCEWDERQQVSRCRAEHEWRWNR